MAEHCKECGKKLPILPIKDLCSGCEFELKYSDKKPANSATTYCRLCGVKLFPESKFCPNCGQQVLEAPTTIQETDYVDLSHYTVKPAEAPVYQTQEYQQPQPAAQPQPIPQPAPEEDPMENPQPAPEEDPMEKLAKLKKMVEAGLITEEDYNTKKAEILSKM